MCDVLQIPRSTIIMKQKKAKSDDELTTAIIEIFHKSRQNYGTRKIKPELKKRGLSHLDGELVALCKKRDLFLNIQSLNLSLI